MKTKYIWVTTEFEAFHKWDNAPKSVEFLKNLHRHIFKVKVYIEVFHNDREIEFISFKRTLTNYLRKQFELKNVGSCEQITEEIIEFIKKNYGNNRKIIVDVSEDGENGAICCWKVY